MFSVDFRTYSLMFADEGFFRARECVSHFRQLSSSLRASGLHSEMFLDQSFLTQVQLGQKAVMRPSGWCAAPPPEPLRTAIRGALFSTVHT